MRRVAPEPKRYGSAMARPLVTLHFSQSLDGRIGFDHGERAVLSSEEGIMHAHRVRSEHDAVLVGIQTILNDDPLLTVRECSGPQPRRVVLDSTLRLPQTTRLLQSQDSSEILVFGVLGRASPEARRGLENHGASVFLVDEGHSGRVSLSATLAVLHELGVRRLLVEGGATVLTAFLRECLADRAEVDIAPCLLGGLAIPSLRDLGNLHFSSAVRLSHLQVERLGPDVFVRGEIVYPSNRWQAER
jgi:riboflavin-specific deaminase-like protein